MAIAGNKAKAVDQGHLQHTENTSSVGSVTTTETVTDTITATLESGFEYDIYTDMIYNSTVANDIAQVRIREDNVTGNSLLDSVVYLPNNGRYFPCGLRASYTATADGSKTFVVTLILSVGTGTLTRYGASGRPAHTWLDKVS